MFGQLLAKCPFPLHLPITDNDAPWKKFNLVKYMTHNRVLNT